MFVPSGQRREVTLVVEAAVDLANLATGSGSGSDAGAGASADVDAGADADVGTRAAGTAEVSVDDIRAMLTHHQFTRAPDASQASLRRLRSALPTIAALVDGITDSETDSDVDRVVVDLNAQLAQLRLGPALTTHGGSPLHLHWTSPSATFDEQVITDLLMALAHEVCDNGTDRFGRCSAVDCSNAFYDTTRNRSRRFCADPRCASRTRTAEHRARQRNRRPAE